MGGIGFFATILELSQNTITIIDDKGQQGSFQIEEPWSQFIPFLRRHDELYIETPLKSTILDYNSIFVVAPRYLVNVTEVLDAITCPRIIYTKLQGADADFNPILHQKMIKGNLLHDLFSERLIHRTDLPDAIQFVINKRQIELILADFDTNNAKSYLEDDGMPLRGISVQGESEIGIRHYGYGLSGRLDGFLDKPLILELKSSKIPGSTPRPNHNIQMNIYQKMMSDHLQMPVTGKVIYLSDKNMAMTNPSEWEHHRTIVARNYTYLVKSGNFNPPILKGEEAKACRNCYQAQGCKKLCAGLIEYRNCDSCVHDSICDKEEWSIGQREFFKTLTLATVYEENESKIAEYSRLRYRSIEDSTSTIHGTRFNSTIQADHNFISEYKHTTKETNFRKGDFVTIYPKSILSPVSEMVYSGIILDITGNEVLIQSINELPEKVAILPSSSAMLLQRSRDIIYKTASISEKTILKQGGQLIWKIIRSLHSESYVISDFNLNETQLISPLLQYNEIQEHAIRSAISTPDFYLIQGPAGTGKTSVIVELVNQLSIQRKSILISAYTNMAVDNIALKLDKHNIEFIRLGNLTSSPPEIMKYSIEYKKNQFKAFVSGNQSCVILATTSTIGRNNYDNLVFDFVLIDEAAQQTVPHSLMPLYHGQRVVLVGDHAQLPAIVQSYQAQEQKLDQSLFELLVRHRNRFVMLEEQYRMSDAILSLPNKLFYESRLRSATVEIGNQKLNFSSKILLEGSYQVIAIEGVDQGVSHRNYYEAYMVVNLVHHIISKQNINFTDIAIIAPFRSQVALLRQLLPRFNIDTIDRFQGSESKIVIFTTTTNIPVPILSDERRINVALTRAKQKLIIIQTNPSEIASDNLMRRIYRDAFRRGLFLELDRTKVEKYKKRVPEIISIMDQGGIFTSVDDEPFLISGVLIYYNSIPLLPVNLDQQTRCHICYQYTEYGLQCPGCTYIFHQDQLIEWVQIHRSCPVCRHRLFTLRV